MSRALCLAAVLALPVVASADIVLYQSDFESGLIDPQWGHTARLDHSPAFTRFMGRYSENTETVLNNSVSLRLQLPDDTGTSGGGAGTNTDQYYLKFDLYAIDSWDGNASMNGPDLFEVFINGANLFSHTFSNHTPGQTYPFAPTVGPVNLGFSSYDADTIYRDIVIPFSAGSATELIVKWRSIGLQGMTDESWGIDNVSVSQVPTPGSAALLSLGGLVFAARRRR
jgi:MYXO-CTERM domain-containing protein